MKISVVIPVYNAQKFIKHCLQSVLSQSLSDIEVVCVDDGSTDQTKQIISQFRKGDNRIVLLEQDNAGSGAARNKALQHVRGEFVAFMDSDDWYPEGNVLEMLYNVAKTNHVKVAGGSFVRYYEDGRVETEFRGIYSAYKFEKSMLMSYDDYQFDYGYHRFIYDRNMLQTCGIAFPPYKRFQDPPFFVRAMIEAGNFFALSHRVYAYRKGHQKVSWDSEKLEGLVCGLTDNLLMSRARGLRLLHSLTITRFNEEFWKIISKQVSGNYRLYFLLKRLIGGIDSSLNQSAPSLVSQISKRIDDSMTVKSSLKDRGDLPAVVVGASARRADPRDLAVMGTPREVHLVDSAFGAQMKNAEHTRAKSDLSIAQISSSPLFDSQWYVEQNPEVKVLEMDPAEHYLKFGWRMGRNPSASFDTRRYLQENPEVAETKVNPLLHYESARRRNVAK